MDKSSWRHSEKYLFLISFPDLFGFVHKRSGNEINLFRWTSEFFDLQYSHFDPFFPFQCCNHVTGSTERISALKMGRGGLAIDKKDFFEIMEGRR